MDDSGKGGLGAARMALQRCEEKGFRLEAVEPRPSAIMQETYTFWNTRKLL